MKSRFAIMVSIALAAAPCLSVACGNSTDSRSAVLTDAPVVWEYPVHLGDSRAKVHELLGDPSWQPNNTKEVYPASGVEIWFSDEGRVTKLSFSGEAAFGLYPSAPAYPVSLASSRKLMLGLTAHTSEGGFRRVLGTPVLDVAPGGPAATERHCIWKTKNLLIDAEFVAGDQTKDGKTFTNGSLLWFYVSPAL